MKHKVSNLDLSIFYSSESNLSSNNLCRKSFHFWRRFWEHFFTEKDVGDKNKMYLDEFENKWVVCLSFQGIPVGLFFYKIVDLGNHINFHHSYFKSYPESVIDFYKSAKFGKVVVPTLMTVHPEFRKSKTEVPLSEILFSIVCEEFKKSEAQQLIGYIRTDNKTDEIFYRHGGVKVDDSHVYGCPVDYCFLNNSTVKKTSLPGVSDAVLDLYSRSSLEVNDMKVLIPHFFDANA